MKKLERLFRAPALIAASAFILNLTHAQPWEPGFKSLFNGKDLAGWEGDNRWWSVKDGAIFCQTTKENPTPKNTFLVYKAQQFDNFELRFSYRVSGGNSGMQYRSELLTNWVMKGYQADFENTNRFTGMFFEENGRMFMGYAGDVVIVKTNPNQSDAKKLHVVEKVGTVGTKEEIYKHVDPAAWNDYVIIANGNQFTHIVNGRVVSVGLDEDTPRFRKSGYVGIQCHSGPPMTIEVKNIRIRALK